MTTVVVRRTAALGDVVLTTPVVRHLRALYPDADIMVQTACPEVYANSPRNVTILSPDAPTPRDALTLNLDLAYELWPTMHIVDAYSQKLYNDWCFSIPPDARLQEMFPPAHDPLPWPAVALHAARSWTSRTLPLSFWLDVSARLRAINVRPIFVGTDRDLMTGSHCNTSLMETAGLLSRCSAFIGSDSSLLHVAAAVGCPVVGLFTSVRPKYRMPIGGAGVAFTPENLDCAGCLERAPIPTTNLTTCERGAHRDPPCVWRFNAGAVVSAAMVLAKSG